MDKPNPIATRPDEQFVVGESDFSYYYNHPERCENGAFLLCTGGRSRASINLYCGDIAVGTVILMLPGSILMFNDATGDFRLRFCAFTREMFSEASYRLEASFFRFLSENPVLVRDKADVRGAEGWLLLASLIYDDREHSFRNTIMKNRLQNICLEMYDKLQRNMKHQAGLGTTRQQELFQRFISLVHEHCRQEREVVFYADRLCITTRYLSTVVRNTAHESPKEIIDRMVILEIKILLQSTDLSVQEIAYRLHFPDQSYMGRYFRKHTGKSPSEYRGLR